MQGKIHEKKERGQIMEFCLSLAVGMIMGLLISWYEISYYGTGFKSLMYCFSAGFFTAAVLYIGLGLLSFIAAAGNFYGLQYIGYALVFTFSFKKAHFEKRRKSYFDYVLEKKEKQNGESPLKRARTLITGMILLLLSLIFTGLFYI